ncbi:MAG: hypothetical protein QOH06_1490 [Acidobacteriota bacterium]|jgi:hypothetical protein|nr:hypothetical protein [Acidobacteriota bacterium]
MAPPNARLALALLLSLPIAAHAASLEDTLNSHWKGGWAVVKVPISSSCDGFYNDNEVVGNRVDSKARRRFDAGELVRVERVGAKRGRVDVFLDLAEAILEERRDGPFTLYDTLNCRIQLRVPIPERADAGGAEARLAELLEMHGSEREAEASSAWNGRRREPFPEGYEQTLAAYESWKAAQTNVAVQERMERAIDEAARINDRVRSDPKYLEGFAAGVDRAKDRVHGDCPGLLRSSFSPEGKGDGDWKRGYEDGQRLAWNLELLRRLKDCFVPVP